MTRKILAVLAGVVVAFALVAIIEAMGHAIYRPPADLDTSDAEAMRAYVSTLPTGALLFVLAAWLVATLVGGWVAAYVARERQFLYAGIVGALMLAAVIANLLFIPHPTWMAVVAVAGVVLMTYAAGRLAPRPRTQST